MTPNRYPNDCHDNLDLDIIIVKIAAMERRLDEALPRSFSYRTEDARRPNRFEKLTGWLFA